jgi:AcrR family transcriptional regulator
MRRDGPVSERALRADARRNRARVLEAAQAVFAAEGLAVPIDEIARRAGVGVGTVYRHFPTKEALFEAIVVTRLQALVDRARELETAAEPGGALFGFLTRLAEEGRAKKDLTDALRTPSPDVQTATSALARDLQEAVGHLLTRAQRAGAVRDDVDIGDLFALVHGAFLAIERKGGDPGSRDRVLAVLHDGLRGRG